jgi:hypothetical protein
VTEDIKQKVLAKKPKRKKRKTKGDPHFEEWWEMVQEFQSESDRAAVILCAAKIDYLLQQILLKYLLPSPSNTDEVFDNEGPASTFSAKINLCYRLRLIDNGMAKSIHIIRKIRNTFAHEMSGGKLDSGTHRDRVNTLYMPYKNTKIFKSFAEDYKQLTHKTFFIVIASIIMMRLQHFLEDFETPIFEDPCQIHFENQNVKKIPVKKA